MKKIIDALVQMKVALTVCHPKSHTANGKLAKYVLRVMKKRKQA